MTTASAFVWSERILAAALALEGLERWTIRRQLAGNGVLRWLRDPRRRRLSRDGLFGWLCGSEYFVFLFPLQTAAASLLFAMPDQSSVSEGALLVLLIMSFLTNLRLARVIDGTHRISLPLLAALLFHRLAPGSPLVTFACLYFITGLSCLSYLTAGIGKLANPEWRSGDALLRTLQVPSLGVPQRIIGYAERAASLVRLLDWTLIAGQITFPLVVIAGRPWLYAWLIFAALMHASNAVLFGYHRFLLVWGATFPAILAVAR